MAIPKLSAASPAITAPVIAEAVVASPTSTGQLVPLGADKRLNKGDAYIRPTTSKGVKFNGVIPANDECEIAIFNSQTVEDARAQVLAELARREGLMADIKPSRTDKQDLIRMLNLRQEKNYNGSLFKVFEVGLNALLAKAERSKITVKDFIWASWATMPKGKTPSGGGRHQTQKTTMVPGLRRYVKGMQAYMEKALGMGDGTGPDVRMIDIIEKGEEILLPWVEEKLMPATSPLASTTRKRNLQDLKRIIRRGMELKAAASLPPFPFYILAGRPDGSKPRTIAPSAEVVRRMKFTLRDKYPELLPFALAQTEFALRPGEAYNALANLRSFFVDDRFNFPVELSKVGTTHDRDVRIRPASFDWFNNGVKGWADGSVNDFRVIEKGEVVPCIVLMKRVYAVLRESGHNPTGTMPDESLRKSCLSATIACSPKSDYVFIADEASHSNLHTLWKHYDARWLKVMGLAYWSTFITEAPHNCSEFELYHAWGQAPRALPLPSQNQLPTIHRYHHDKHAA